MQVRHGGETVGVPDDVTATITFWRDRHLDASDGIQPWGAGWYELTPDGYHPRDIGNDLVLRHYGPDYPALLERAAREALNAVAVTARVDGDVLHLAAGGYELSCVRSKPADVVTHTRSNLAADSAELARRLTRARVSFSTVRGSDDRTCLEVSGPNLMADADEQDWVLTLAGFSGAPVRFVSEEAAGQALAAALGDVTAKDRSSAPVGPRLRRRRLRRFHFQGAAGRVPGFVGFEWRVLEVAHDGETVRVPEDITATITFWRDGHLVALDGVRGHDASYGSAADGYHADDAESDDSDQPYGAGYPVLLAQAVEHTVYALAGTARLDGDLLALSAGGYQLSCVRSGPAEVMTYGREQLVQSADTLGLRLARAQVAFATVRPADDGTALEVGGLSSSDRAIYVDEQDWVLMLARFTEIPVRFVSDSS